MHRWLREPIVVIPVTCGLIAILVLVFQANTTATVQFFGAFLAAIVAALAVVLTTGMQDRFVRERTAEDRRIAMVAAAIDLHTWLDNLASTFSYAEALYRDYAKVPGMVVTVESLRSTISADTREQLRLRTAAAAQMPAQLAPVLLRTLHGADDGLSRLAYMENLDATTALPVGNLTTNYRLAGVLLRQICIARLTLGQELVNLGVYDRLDNKDTCVHVLRYLFDPAD